MQIKIERVFSVERCFEKQKRKKQSHSFDEIGLVMITRARHQTECVETVVMREPIAEIQQLAKATVAEIEIEHEFAHYIPIKEHAHDVHAHPHDYHHD